MEADPLASMRCWAIELELGGRTYEVPALSAVDWWPVIASGDPMRVLDFVVSTPTDPFNLDDLILSGEADTDEIGTVVMDAVEETAGRTFHAAYVLVTVATSNWAMINGELTRRGFRWEGLPLGAALDALYAEITNRLDKDALTKFLALLDNEALTTGNRRGRARERALSQFETMAGPRPTSGVKSTGEPSEGQRSKTRTRPRQPRQGARSTEPTPRP